MLLYLSTTYMYEMYIVSMSIRMQRMLINPCQHMQECTIATCIATCMHMYVYM